MSFTPVVAVQPPDENMSDAMGVIRTCSVSEVSPNILCHNLVNESLKFTCGFHADFIRPVFHPVLSAWKLEGGGQPEPTAAWNL